MQSFKAEPGIHGVWQTPGAHTAGGPIHDRHQVQKAVLHRDVRNVDAPDLIGPLDRHAPQQIGINLVFGMGVGGSGRLIDRLQAHQPHQAANPVPFRHLRIPPQGAEYTLTHWPVCSDLLTFTHSCCVVPTLVCGDTLLEISTPTDPRTSKRYRNRRVDGGEE
jgi:hypothetical protein